MARRSRPHSQKDVKPHWIVAVSEIEHGWFGVDRYIRSQPRLPSLIGDSVAGAAKSIGPRSGRQDAPGVNFPGWGQDDLIPAGANAPRDKPGKRIESAARFAAWRRQADCWKEGRRLQTGDTVPSPSGILRRHPLHGAAPSAKERKTTNSEWQHDARSPNTGRRWARRGRRHRVHGDGMGRMYWLRFRKRRRCCVGQGTGHCDPASPHAIKRQNPDARFKSR